MLSGRVVYVGKSEFLRFPNQHQRHRQRCWANSESVQGLPHRAEGQTRMRININSTSSAKSKKGPDDVPSCSTRLGPHSQLELRLYYRTVCQPIECISSVAKLYEEQRSCRLKTTNQFLPNVDIRGNLVQIPRQIRRWRKQTCGGQHHHTPRFR